MANNILKYINLDPSLRTQQREAWNRPVLWPLGLLFGALVLSAVPAAVSYWRREVTPARPDIDASRTAREVRR